MKVSEKIERAKEVLSSIIDHDDAPREEIETAIVNLKTFLDKKWKEAVARRKENKENK
jgi:hypothetical protein